jgi:aspartate 1-decarboxylase
MINVLKCKLHRATVTEADLNYDGSITIDRELMDEAGIHPFEMVHVLNINNGERIETYAIAGPAGSGQICMNGAAARKFLPGDLIIVLATKLIPESDIREHKPKIICLNSRNKPINQ